MPNYIGGLVRTRLIKRLLLLAGLTLTLTACETLSQAYRFYLVTCYYGAPVQQTEFPQVFLDIDFEDYNASLNRHSDIAAISIAETISYQGQDLPIRRLKLSGGDDRRLLILAGVHGNEAGGTLAIPELLDAIKADRSLIDGWTIEFLTPVNPVGLIERSRYNQNGCDLNRKVASMDEPGIQLQRQTVDGFKPDIAISLHEAPITGFLIHPGPHLDDDYLAALLAALETQSVQLATDDYLGRRLETPGRSRVSGVLKTLKHLVQVQSLGDYLAERDIVEITTETGWNNEDPKQRITPHVALIIEVLRTFSQSN